MINIRLALNERPRRFGGNIGFSIRPSERGKGCNKINLYPWAEGLRGARDKKRSSGRRPGGPRFPENDGGPGQG